MVMRRLRFKIGDIVMYAGNNSQAKGKVGRIVNVKDDDTEATSPFYPKNGYDFAVKFRKFGFVPFVLDVKENEIESTEL
jgi:hypothetical protein